MACTISVRLVGRATSWKPISWSLLLWWGCEEEIISGFLHLKNMKYHRRHLCIECDSFDKSFIGINIFEVLLLIIFNEIVRLFWRHFLMMSWGGILLYHCDGWWEKTKVRFSIENSNYRRATAADCSWMILWMKWKIEKFSCEFIKLWWDILNEIQFFFRVLWRCRTR